MIEARDLLNWLAALLMALSGGVLWAIWQELVKLRRRVHDHASWLIDHEAALVENGKPSYRHNVGD